MAAVPCVREELRGHAGGVMCVHACPYDENLVASASEDGTARIWDMRTRTAVRCVSARSWAGSSSGSGGGGPHTELAVNAVRFGRGAGCDHLYAAAGACAAAFDLRRTEVVLHKAALPYDPVGEEIAAIADCDGSQLIVADDDGVLTVFEPASGSSAPVRATRAHESLCAAVTWLPSGARGGEGAIVSGGLDCAVCVWCVCCTVARRV